MRAKLTLSFLLVVIQVSSQDVINPYQNLPTYPSHQISGSGPGQTFQTGYNLALGSIGYNGEYQVFPNLLGNWGNQAWHKTIEIETVSFPFTPQNECAFSANGCTSSVPERILSMPISAYDPITRAWGELDQFAPLPNEEKNTLSSYAFIKPSAMNSVQAALPHTILKHTIKIHCGQNATDPVVTSISFYYDNTRGRMRYYPFLGSNQPNAGPEEYDICFRPQFIVNKPFHNYSANFNAIGLTNFGGTIDYFPFNEIPSPSPCSIPGLNTPFNSNSSFYIENNQFGNDFIKAWPAPYTLLSSFARNARGEIMAGYSLLPIVPNGLLPGIKHQYKIDRNISLSVINPNDKIIFNASDADVTADNLVFPSEYTFKTIRGVYPSALQAQNDNTTINGGPYPDPRLVPVRTDLRCEDPAFPNDASILKDSRYASLYRMQAGSQITIEPCVKIFDAAFILHPGSTLKYENYNTQIGYVETDENISRVAIDRLGGRLIRQYDATLPAATLYLQDRTETAVAPNTYVVDERIIAGSNVDPNQNAGPYIASTGSDVELIANNYVKLSDGFIAQPGASLKVAIDAQMNIPACPPPRPASANRYAHPDIETSSPLKAKAVLAPNPIQQQAVITLLQSGQENYIRQIEVRDSKGKLLIRRDEVNKLSESIDMSTLPDGFYLITVITNNSSEVLKAVVNRN